MTTNEHTDIVEQEDDAGLEHEDLNLSKEEYSKLTYKFKEFNAHMLIHHNLQEEEEEDLPREGPAQILHHNLHQEKIGKTHTSLGLDQHIGCCLVMNKMEQGSLTFLI
jgi:hypothetical protein